MAVCVPTNESTRGQQGNQSAYSRGATVHPHAPASGPAISISRVRRSRGTGNGDALAPPHLEDKGSSGVLVKR